MNRAKIVLPVSNDEDLLRLAKSLNLETAVAEHWMESHMSANGLILGIRERD